MPDEIRLPTEEEIAQLPRWAQVAFAARCARRVQPLFTAGWAKSAGTRAEAVDRAISLTEAYAADPTSGNPTSVREAADSVYKIAYATAESDPGSSVRRAASDAAFAAASAAFDHNESFQYAKHASLGAPVVEGRVNPERVLQAMRRDFELLQGAAQREKWTDDTPVPMAFFGPLWPEGEPEGWPGGDHTEPTERMRRPPSEQELQRLPRWAQVLFALRCATRALPLFTYLWPEAPEQLVRRLREWTQTAENDAALGGGNGFVILLDLGEADAPVHALDHVDPKRGQAAAGVARAAVHANNAVERAAKAQETFARGNAEKASRINRQMQSEVWGCWAGVLEALSHSSTQKWRSAFITAARRDLDELEGRSARLGWDDTTPLQVASLGDLWPFGEPQGWPKDDRTRVQYHVRWRVDPPGWEADQIVYDSLKGSLPSLGVDWSGELNPDYEGDRGYDARLYVAGGLSQSQLDQLATSTKQFAEDSSVAVEDLSIREWVEPAVDDYGLTGPSQQVPRESRLTIRIPVPPMADTPETRAELKRHIKELVLRANLLNREHGGPGLEIAGGRITSPAGVIVCDPAGGGS